MDIDRMPADLKARYMTAFDIDPNWIIAAAARRQKWIDQSQSVNLWIKTPDQKTLSHMYRQAWHAGLKTTYYLRRSSRRPSQQGQAKPTGPSQRGRQANGAPSQRGQPLTFVVE